MKCGDCDWIKDSVRVKTGMDEKFPEGFYRLKALKNSPEIDFLQCLSCGSFFLWENFPQYMGTGNQDEECLKRFSDKECASVKSLLSLSEDPEKCRNQFDVAWNTLGYRTTTPLIYWISCQKPLQFRHLIKPLVNILITFNDENFRDLLGDFADTDKARNEILIRELTEHPGPRKPCAESLLQKCINRLKK